MNKSQKSQLRLEKWWMEAVEKRKLGAVGKGRGWGRGEAVRSQLLWGVEPRDFSIAIIVKGHGWASRGQPATSLSTLLKALQTAKLPETLLNRLADYIPNECVMNLRM